ncbi:Ig-like domain-containing protein [Candidatus Daviesbacteria bacterium]|nr:Ig-like domain-containing protein [Candidatus Daviesbacteria bacterium]
MKKKIFIGLIIAVILPFFFYLNSKENKQSSITTQVQTNEPTPTSNPNDPPRIVSTKPEGLDNSIIATNIPIEISFNRPLENKGELKIRIEPEIAFKVELSSDRKTGIITFEKTLDLGMTYTLFIGPETKFDGIGRWGEEKVFHFRTIPYKGV